MRDQFLSLRNFQSICRQIPEFGLLALGIGLAMLTGGIDLSVVGIASLNAIIAAFILTKLKMQQGSLEELLIIILTIIVVMLISTLCGFINGFIISYFKVSPILVTLGTGGVFLGIGIIVSKSRGITGFPERFLSIGSDNIWIFPIPIVIFIFFLLLVVFILNKTIFGSYIYMVGSNPIAAHFSNINVNLVLIKVYSMSGFFAGISSLIMISRANSAKSYYGSSYLLLSVLICILGGIVDTGGSGSISGLFMAIIILQLLQSIFNMFAINPFVRNIAWGSILIIVMIINFFIEEYRKKAIRNRH